MNRHVSFLAVLIMCILICNTAQAIVQYTVTDLGTLGGETSYACGINDSGQVVGYSPITVGGPCHAFLYSGSTMKDLGTLGGKESYAYDINNSGQVVGYDYTSESYVYRAFLYNGSTMTDIGTLGGTSSSAYGINDSGQIVGWAHTTNNYRQHAFLYSGSTMTDLGTLGGTHSQARNINNSGQVVGYSYITGNTADHAFFYSGSTMTDLGTLGGEDSYACSINASGQVVGRAQTTDNAATHAFLYSGSSMIDLGTLGGKNSYANGINDSGLVVGMSYTTEYGGWQAFLYNGLMMIDLNTLIDPSSGWYLEIANDINNNGQIVGWGNNNGNEFRAFLLTPVPEPSMMALIATGIILPIGYLWRRRCGQIKLLCYAAVLTLLTTQVSKADVFNMPDGLTSLEIVAVGNPGNAGELSGVGAGGYGTNRICGAVADNYQIGKFEITAGQYAEFLNAVAAADTYGLYHTNMANTSSGYWGCNIQRTGTSGSYNYSVAPDWADRPVNWVSWGDAARFANWLHNGQPTGAQDLSTTENGSYFLNGATSDSALQAVTRKSSATWVIPSEDEWYKAAYHKNDGVTGNYFDYPTGSDSVPSNDLVEPTDPGNNATYGNNDLTIGSPYWRTEVGDHENSESLYNTFDQGGNVWEWNEESFYGSSRGWRGGTWGGGYGWMAAFDRSFSSFPSNEGDYLGFRVARVPEPSSIVLLCIGTTSLLAYAGQWRKSNR